MSIVFEGKSCEAHYEKQNERLLIQFEGYPNMDEHKQMYGEIIQFMKSNKTSTFLMNFHKFKGTFTGLTGHVIETLRPGVELGLKKTAMVLNDDIFTVFSANDALAKVKMVEIQVFKITKEAEDWLNK